MVTLPWELPPNWMPTYLSPVPADVEAVTVSAALLL
jgi:hypothetical protein